MPESQSAETKKLNDYITERVQYARTAQNRRIEAYIQGLNYALDNQLADQEIKSGFNLIQANYVFPAMMQELAFLSQRLTSILALPQEPSDVETAKVWQSHLQWLFEYQLKFKMHQIKAALDGKIFGHYITYPYWNPRCYWDTGRKAWVGQPEVTLVHPFNFFPDPEAEGLKRGDCTYVVVRRKVSRDWAIWRWPQFRDVIEKASDPEKDESAELYGKRLVSSMFEDGKDRPLLRNDGELVSSIMESWGLRSNVIAAGEIEKPDRSTTITLEQILTEDYKEKKSKDEREQGFEWHVGAGLAYRDDDGVNRWRDDGSPWPGDRGAQTIIREFDEPTFPNGRLILRIGDTILNPKDEDQVWGSRRWPYILGVNQLLPHVWYGLNNIAMAKGLQDFQNKALRSIDNWIANFADPRMLVEPDGLIGGNDKVAPKLKAQAGAIVKVRKGGIRDKVIDILQPPTLSQGVFQTVSEIQQVMRDQTGMQDIGLGRQMRGGATATEAQNLATNSRLRQALSNALMDNHVVEVFEYLTEVCQNNYQVGDVVRIVGDQYAATVMQIYQRMKDAPMDIRIKVGTDLPFDRDRIAQNYKLAAEIISAAPYMAKQVLEALQIEGKDDILKGLQDQLVINQTQQQIKTAGSQPELLGDRVAQKGTALPVG